MRFFFFSLLMFLSLSFSVPLRSAVTSTHLDGDAPPAALENPSYVEEADYEADTEDDLAKQNVEGQEELQYPPTEVDPEAGRDSDAPAPRYSQSY